MPAFPLLILLRSDQRAPDSAGLFDAVFDLAGGLFLRPDRRYTVRLLTFVAEQLPPVPWRLTLPDWVPGVPLAFVPANKQREFPSHPLLASSGRLRLRLESLVPALATTHPPRALTAGVTTWDDYGTYRLSPPTWLAPFSKSTTASFLTGAGYVPPEGYANPETSPATLVDGGADGDFHTLGLTFSLTLPVAARITGYKVRYRNGQQARAPQEWVLFGGDVEDGKYTPLHAVEDANLLADQDNLFWIPEEDLPARPFRILRFVVTQVGTSTSDPAMRHGLGLNALEFYSRDVTTQAPDRLLKRDAWFQDLAPYNLQGAPAGFSGSGSVRTVQLTTRTADMSNAVAKALRIQDYRRFTLTFWVYVTTGSQADALYFFCGCPQVPALERAHGSGAAVEFNVTSSTAFLHVGGAQAVVQAPAPSLKASAYRRVDIIYTRGAADTWVVRLHGQELFRYSDPGVERWRAASGAFFGIGARTGAQTADIGVRSVELEAFSEPAWAAQLAVEELPDA